MRKIVALFAVLFVAVGCGGERDVQAPVDVAEEQMAVSAENKEERQPLEINAEIEEEQPSAPQVDIDIDIDIEEKQPPPQTGTETEVDYTRFQMPETGVDYEPPIFTENDINFLDISLLDSLETLVGIMGEPDSVESMYLGYYGADVYFYRYDDFGEVWLYPGIDDSYSINRISVTNPKYTGPRGTAIGDGYEKIISAFFADTSLPDEIVYGERILYQVLPYYSNDGGKIKYDEQGNVTDIFYHYYYAQDYTEYYLAYGIEDGKVIYIAIGWSDT